MNSITNVFIGYLLLGDTAPTFNGIKQLLFIVVCEGVGNSSRARQGQHSFDPCGIGVGWLVWARRMQGAFASLGLLEILGPGWIALSCMWSSFQ